MQRLSAIQLRKLRPHTDEQDQPTESPAQYCDRVRAVLPTFPDEVICQFFYEHDSNVEHHAWLNYPSLSFESAMFLRAQLHLPCFSAHPTITQYSEHFIKGNTSKRMSDIAAHFKTSGTWPIAPIVLANPDGELRTSWGLQCDAPYHLLEGHHRMAVYAAFAKRSAVNSEHRVWVARVGS